MLTPTILSMGLRRVPGMIQGAARGLEQAPATMREALMQQSGPQQSVAEILSEGLPEMTPNLGKATSAASRQRQIADMLLQGAQQQDNTSIAGGLSQLGQAFLARRAGQKADTAEDKQREMASLLLQQAMGEGPESQAARAQLFADSPAALVAQSDAQRATQAEQQRTQMQNEMIANLYPEESKERAMILAGVGAAEATKQAFAPQAPQERWEQIEAPSGMPGFYERSTLTGETRRVAGPPDAGVTVNNNLPGEKGENKFQEGLGSNAANNFQTIVDEGRAAGASIGNLDTMETLLDSIDYTGFGGDTLLQVQRAGAMIGIEIEDLPAKEAAKRLSSQMALSLKTDLPGPMSNADREFLLSIPPNLNSTAAGNDAILFILRKREERKQDMMRSVLQADPQSMQEYRDWENQYLQTTPPMFTPATQASLLKALGGTGQ